MNKARDPRLAALLLLLMSVGFAQAQSSEEAAAQAAEQAGKPREALTHYATALQSASDGSGEDRRLREKIIKLVGKLEPPPAVPEEARGFFVRANTAVKEAKGPGDYDSAIEKYQRALRLAPWWLDAYFNLASAYEARGNFSGAIAALKLYLVGAPAGGPEARQAQDKIYALQEKEELAQKEAAAKLEAEEQARRAEDERRAQVQRIRDSLSNGRWCPDQMYNKFGSNCAQIQRHRAALSEMMRVGFNQSWAQIRLLGDQVTIQLDYDNGSGSNFTLKLDGLHLVGTQDVYPCCPREFWKTFPAGGDVTYDGLTISVVGQDKISFRRVP